MSDLEEDNSAISVNGERTVDERRNGSSSKSLKETSQSTLNFQLEFLDSCEFNCAGCFVKRRNAFTDEDMDTLLDLAARFAQKDFEMNEIILGPTDLFGCKNAMEIITHPKFARFFEHFHALSFPTTLQSDPERVRHVMGAIKEHLPDDIYLEVFVVFDIVRFHEDNDAYLKRLDENLITMQGANIIFAFNIHDHAFDINSFHELTEMVNERYNSHLKMVPSFFRSPNKEKIMDNLDMWKQMLNESIDEDSAPVILNNMADPNFGGYTYYFYTFKDGKLYSSPFIYDFIFDANPHFELPRQEWGYCVDDIFEWEKKNILNQFEYSKDAECADCPYLPACVGKRVLSYMKAHKIKECILPIKSIKYQNNLE